MSARTWSALLVAATISLAGCGQDADPGDGAATEGWVTVEQALAERPDGEVTIRGFLIDSGGDVRLCELVLESYPPQCGGASVVVEGVDVAARDDATTEGDISWVDQAELTGQLEGDTFVVTD